MKAMQSPQEFIESFIREKKDIGSRSFQVTASFYRKFLTGEYAKALEDCLADREPETVVSVEASETSARVIRVGAVRKHRLRHRYPLRVSGSTWQIFGRESECYACGGKGRIGTIDCEACGGAGWRQIFPPSGP